MKHTLIPFTEARYIQAVRASHAVLKVQSQPWLLKPGHTHSNYLHSKKMFEMYDL